MNTLGQLRSIRDEELEMMRSWRNAPAVRANMYTRHEISEDEHRAWWDRTRQRQDQQYLMYEHLGTPIGIVGFSAIDHINSNCSWAFYASPEARKGTGTHMEFLALENAFYILKMNKLYCEVLAFNTPVIKLHQKFGFQVEGIFRQHHRISDSFVDIYRLGLLASEWGRQRDGMLSRIMQTSRAQ